MLKCKNYHFNHPFDDIFISYILFTTLQSFFYKDMEIFWLYLVNPNTILKFSATLGRAGCAFFHFCCEFVDRHYRALQDYFKTTRQMIDLLSLLIYCRDNKYGNFFLICQTWGIIPGGRDKNIPTRYFESKIQYQIFQTDILIHSFLQNVHAFKPIKL